MTDSERIDAFEVRILTDRSFCEELFRKETVRLLAAKYAYYIVGNGFLTDYGFDASEHCWYIMGRALGHLKEDEKSVCIDFDYKHEFAKEAIKLAYKLRVNKKEKPYI